LLQKLGTFFCVSVGLFSKSLQIQFSLIQYYYPTQYRPLAGIKESSLLQHAQAAFQFVEEVGEQKNFN
jgi:hypothetical protein